MSSLKDLGRGKAMNPAIQDTLLQLFEHVQHDPASLPTIPIDEWDEGSAEWRLLESFRCMAEQVHERFCQLGQAEQHVREQEELYHSAFDATNDGLFIGDLDGTIVEVNPAACKMYGYTHEEMIGLTGFHLNHPDSHPLIEELNATLPPPGTRPRLMAVRKDGTTFYTEGQVAAFTYKGKQHRVAAVRDITSQVQAEEQLREREEQYRSIFEATYDGIDIFDSDGFFVEVNPAFCNMFGYTREELIGMHASVLVAPQYLPILDEVLKTLGTSTGYQTVVGEGVRKDGTTIYTESHGTPFTYKGKLHLLGVSRDITERVKAERQLRDSEEQYRGVFETTYDGLVISDLENGCYVEVNPAFCRMFGYTRDELIGMHSSALAAPVDLHLVDEVLETLREGQGYQTVVGQGLRKDGSMFYMESQGTTFTYRGRPHSLAVVRDITERVQAEQQLREREEQYRSVFEATNDALVVMNLDGFFVEVNPAFCSMFGYTREEIIGKHGSITTAPETLPILDDFLNTFKARSNYETPTGAQGVRKDGTLFYSESHATMLTYQGRSHVLGIIRDITEQVQAQQLLEQRVEERTRELASLLEISHTVASTLQLEPLVNLILDQLKTMVHCTGASIFTLEGDRCVILDIPNPTPEEQLMQLRFSPRYLGLIWKAMTSREMVLLSDVRSESPTAQALREAMGELMDTRLGYVRACLFVPLTLKDRVVGMLVMASSEANAFTQHHAELALAIANQAAVAIENARLYEQAQELASIEERQRLARELHDSVSQALYGISLGVHTARMQLDRDPKDLAESLDYVLELAEMALVEMRALIFELRPESLETEGPVTALTKQAAALQARQHTTVNTDLCAEPDLPLKVKQDLYRVAQEALHNTVKHAHASKVELRLQQTSETVTLEVCDNGRGFDVTTSFPGHLGLHSMHERVTGLGGELRIKSTPGQGTCIRVQVPGRDAM
jgi:PAS domain S-box-containing protein